MVNIHFKTQYAEFQYTMEHKYLNIIGDSAIGKTSFYEMVDEYNSSPDVNLGDMHVLPMPSVATVATILQNTSNFVYVADEDDDIWQLPNIVDLIAASNNYFILINRSSEMASFKMGLDDICTIRQDGIFYTFTTVFPRRDFTTLARNIICEDLKAGKQFISNLFSNNNVVSAGGKARIGRAANKLCKKCGASEVTLVYDRAGINYDYIEMIEYCKQRDISIVSEIDWDSFEAYLLHDPDNYIDFEAYPNAESAAYAKLKELFPDYDKSELIPEFNVPIYWKIHDALKLANSEPKLMKI